MIKSAQEFVELRTSTSPEDYLRAAYDTASLEVWIEVVKNFPDMKVWVIRNKTVPIAILTDLASDPDPAVRAAVASKNKLPRHLMDLLAADPEAFVRHRLVYNKNAGLELLQRLVQDKSDLVSSTARQRLEHLTEMD